jgi:hypothetical protein
MLGILPALLMEDGSERKREHDKGCAFVFEMQLQTEARHYRTFYIIPKIDGGANETKGSYRQLG